MGFIKEFKEFALKGNVVDLAIAVVIGAAFGRIVTALTESILMPIVSLIMGKGGVSEVKFTVGETVFPIGVLLQSIIDFILVALVLFMVIKAMNSLKRKKEDAAAPAEPPQYTLTGKVADGDPGWDEEMSVKETFPDFTKTNAGLIGLCMLEDSHAETAYKALKFAVQRLNAVFPEASVEGGLERHVEFRIIQPYLKRELLYKIDNSLSDEIKGAIRSAVIEQAKKLRIKVLTVR